MINLTSTSPGISLETGRVFSPPGAKPISTMWTLSRSATCAQVSVTLSSFPTRLRFTRPPSETRGNRTTQNTSLFKTHALKKITLCISSMEIKTVHFGQVKYIYSLFRKTAGMFLVMIALGIVVSFQCKASHCLILVSD